MSLLDTLSDVIRQNRHPVYNANGRQVGSYVTLDALCKGQWLLFAGETAPPAGQLYVQDFWGRRVPLSTQCVRAATKPNPITQPQPVTPAGAQHAVQAGGDAGIDLSALVLPPDSAFDFGNVFGDVVDTAAKPATEKLLIFGGLALVAGLVLFSGSRR